MNKRDWTVGAVLAITWVVIGVGIPLIAGSSEALHEYSAVAAWCVLLVMAIILRPALMAVTIYLVAVLVTLLVDVALSGQVVYHDPPPLRSLGMIALAGMYMAFWATPFLVAGLVNVVRRRFVR
jgi:hypothetical protein